MMRRKKAITISIACFIVFKLNLVLCFNQQISSRGIAGIEGGYSGGHYLVKSKLEFRNGQNLSIGPTNHFQRYDENVGDSSRHVRRQLPDSMSSVDESAQPNGQGQVIVHKQNLGKSPKLNHLIVDQMTGNIFIGGVNYLFHLSANLDIINTAETGPQNDSLQCSKRECTSGKLTKQLTDNVNKVLLIDYTSSGLLECGTVFQGACNIRNLQNISLIEIESQDAIVANSENGSTVAFIAAGPSDTARMPNVLYIGVTYTNNSLYRGEIPAVASRSLNRNNLFHFASTAVTTGTRAFINVGLRETYLINYVYGFSSEKFSYFLTTQLKSTSLNAPKEYITKLVRICQDDSHYYSYMEIPVDCIATSSENQMATKYNLVQAAYLGKPGAGLAANMDITPQSDVLYAVFSEGDDNRPTNKSALCIYSMQAIRRKFMQNIKSCYQGIGMRGVDYISPNMPCLSTKLQTINEDFCGLDVNSPLGGEQPIAAVPAATFVEKVTSVAATQTGNYTVVFVGTDKGHLKKIIVESGSSGLEYADIPIEEGASINNDMHLDKEAMHVYVMSIHNVYKVKVQDCTQYKTCSECLDTKDPYCGWCSQENKCSLRSNCQNDQNDTLAWVTYRAGKCTSITNVTPNQLQRTTARTLELTIDHLPKLKEPLFCAFSTPDKPPLLTPATLKKKGVNCTTPQTSLLPQISSGKHHFTTKLSVRTQNGPDLVSTEFKFFDCSTHSSCTQCVSSEFPCDWCVEAHRCTHDTAENCRNDILVTGVSRVGPSYRSGPSFCPTISITDGSEILVAAGVKKSIKVKVHIIGQFIVQTRFVCQFNIEGRVTTVNAQLLGDTIYCDPMEFAYTSRSPNLTAKFAVIWGGSKPLDNPHDIHIVIYRCRDMADSCGMCLALPDKYGCGWCSSTNSCEVEEQCHKDGEHKTDWLNRQQTCPNPKILSFQPMTGPWEGGTNITINGINLGKNFTDIYSGVKIAGINCMPWKDLYVVTKQIVCTVDGPGANQYRPGRIVVQISDYRGESETDFKFVDPKVYNFDPKFGPISGGTQIRITGKYLNAGSRIQAFIDTLPCQILSVDDTEALCRTSPSNKGQMSGKLKMHFDNAVRELSGTGGEAMVNQFRYVQDPVIEYTASGPINQLKTAKGIPAGGIKITVIGQQFDAIQSPKIYVYYQDKIFLNECKVKSAIEMICDSPTIDADQDQLLTSDDPILLEYGFQMDDVLSVQNLSFKYQQFQLQNLTINENALHGKYPYRPFELYPNPEYYPFEEHKKYYTSEYLTINGRHIDRACRESDIEVKIGDETCNITSLSRQQLTCLLPKGQESSVDEAPVVVRVANNLNFNIGVLSYNQPNGLQGLSTKAIGGILAVAVIVVIVFVFLLVAYRKKTSKSNRLLKNMQEQMDILELRVAAECKEAFAELQTEMTDLTGELSSGGIPFLDYRTYAMKILFPSYDDHVVLQWQHPELLKKEKGLRQFGQLIMNKTFLLLFIRTLESNRYFSMRERVNVASLIMVTLQSKLEYCTDILKTLLAELIEKCIEGKSHPKLLLRRTESVAEKMLSAWFTFLLYKFLKECAGDPLYMLFRAVKGQIDKGPVDACTHEARYSLSEEKLIRQMIEYKVMTIYASITQQQIIISNNDNVPTLTENVPVKVLDCDTISQVKEKCLDTIYRNTSYSDRPRHDELDLEWRTGSSGRVILFDEDMSSKIDGEWKRLNTLNHYNVPDYACLSLVPKQASLYNLNLDNKSLDNQKFLAQYPTMAPHKYETLNMKYMTGGQQQFGTNTSISPQFSRAGSPLNQEQTSDSNGYKYWHLVKHHEGDAMQRSDVRGDGSKMVSEIYLTRLLATKGTLQKFVDDLFETIFSTAHRGSALPLAIKYMFDFLDDQAIRHGITDPEVVHTWKSNSLPLRFWVNLIKNPNFVFDIHKSNIVDSCLSVVAQTFMDSCSTSDHRLGKDSPSSKLLYAKDIPQYRDWVDRYYNDIRDMPAISDQDMNAMLAEESRSHTTEFNINCALHELYMYAVKYNEQLNVTLDEDEFSTKQRLAYRLEQVHTLMTQE